MGHVPLSINMLILLLTICLFSSAAFGRDHTIVGAKEFRVGSQNNVVLNFHGYSGTATVEATLQTLPRRLDTISRIQHQVVNVEHPLELEFTVNEEQLVEERRFRNSYVELHIAVTNSNEDFEESIPILLNDTSGYVFLTTDRPAYRPGDTVKIIAALTDQNLMPSQDIDVDIVIRTPEEAGGTGKIGVDRQTITTSRQQFMSHEYAVPPVPLIGKWFIEASVPTLGINSETTFLVDRYELPTFNVKVQMEHHYVLPTQPSIIGEIRAEYSYGKKVTGFYFITVKLKRNSEVPYTTEIYRDPEELTRRKIIRNGRHGFTIPISAVENSLEAGETLQSLADEGASLTVEVSVTGKAESIYESAIVSGIRFTSSPYLIVTDRSSRYFNPGIVYEVKADVLDVVTRQPIPDIPVLITAGQRQISRPSNARGQIQADIDQTNVDEMIITLTTDKEGLAEADQYSTTLTVQKHRGNALMSVSMNSLAVVGRPSNARFRFEPPDVTDSVRYFIVSKGQVVSSGVMPVQGQRGDRAWDIEVTHQMVPSARLVAYYMRGNELVSNSVWFDVTDVCGGNELEVQISAARVAPESPVEITVRGNPNARFHLSAVDRAAYYVYNGSRLTRDVMWNKMEEYDNACSREGGSDSRDVFEEAGIFLVNKLIRPKRFTHPTCDQPVPRKRRQAPSSENSNAAIAADRELFLVECQLSGTIPSLGEENCRKRKDRVLGSKGEECAEMFELACNETQVSEDRQTLARSNAAPNIINAMGKAMQRSNFHENWLWITNSLNADGGWISENLKSSGSISTFEFTAFSSSDQGFCIAKPSEVTVFKDVFIQLYLPYSVRLMEQASIRYAVFNYLPGEIEVEVRMSHGEELCSLFPANEQRHISTLRVLGNSAKSSYFTVMPVKIPNDKLGVRIEMTVSSPHGNDHIVKHLLVEPSGLLNESSKSFVLAPPANRIIHLEVPDDGFEPKTRECWIHAYANVLGPIAVPDPITNRYNNLQSLINIPDHCGEQNMIRTAPIVHIHKYRLATNVVQRNGPEEAQVIAYIKKGYGIELGWRSDSDKRGWAVWNSRPPSVWLNAFVDRVFLEARDIYQALDPQPICSSLEWLMEQQRPDGQFIESYSVLHREMDGLVEGEIAMTAYVAATLAIAEQPERAAPACPALVEQIRSKKEKALEYLNEQSTALMNNVYATAVTAYGLAVSHSELANAWIMRLRGLCTENAEHIYCLAAGGQAGKVETTSYALLAEISHLPDQVAAEDLRRVRKMALWLVEQRNSFGGSQTTQDTVMALQASAEYMKWIHRINQEPPPTNMDVTLTSTVPGTAWHQNATTIHLNDQNEILQRDVKVPQNVIGSSINVHVTGVGEASMSYRCIWRENVDGARCPFQIDATFGNPEAGVATLKINIHKLENPDAGMSIVDVGLISGYDAVTDTIENLMRDKRVDGIVDSYEITDNSVKFYLNKIQHDSDTVLAFKLKQNSVVQNVQPAGIRVYDYYNPEISCSKFYSMDDSPNLRFSCNNEGDRSGRICKCAEGGCPKCRTRQEITTNSKCISLQVSQRKIDKQCLGNNKVCSKPNGIGCIDTKAKACQRHYMHYVKVIEVRKNDPPNFVEFDAETTVTSPLPGVDPEQGVKTFRIRNDCFTLCRDDALTKNTVDLIKVDRELIIYGNEPQRKVIGGVTSYLYNLDEESRIEVTPGFKKCRKIKRKKCNHPFISKLCIRKRICYHHEKLRKKVFKGCG